MTEDTGERNEDASENKIIFSVSMLCKLKEQFLCLTVLICLLYLFPAYFYAIQVKLIWFGTSLVS